MKRILMAVCLFASILCACGQVSNSDTSNWQERSNRGQASDPDVPTWQEQYDLGVRYLSEGNYKEAIIAFTAAIEIDPKQAPAYVGRGDAYVGVGRMGETVDGELPQEMISSYESARADYLSALDLDESKVDVYRKTAELYVILGDLDSAIALLERGITATDDGELQSYLDELIEKQSFFVLIRQDSYSPLASSTMHSAFTYDQSGFQVNWDAWSLEDGKEDHWRSVAWSYDEAQDVWMRKETKNGESKTDVLKTRQLGTAEYWSSEGFGGGYVYSDPYNEDNVPEGNIAKYTYDEYGNATRIDTYDISGTLTGYCILTWEKINPIERRNLT